ncbi:MAG: flagellar biosynthesis anti-sigma factor FlgM [Vicinamibacterales bacterium]
MKIDGNRPGLDHAALQRLEKAATESAKQATTKQAHSGDTVQVSADATLAHNAVKAANETPDVRADLVEKMRALLASGELGHDAGAIADSLIDSMTTHQPGDSNR